MKSYLVLAAALLAARPAIALAQSSIATSGTTAPMTTAPAAGNGAMPAGQNSTMPTGQNKVVIPPAARSGEKGLKVGNDAMGDPIEIKRNK